MLFNYTKKIKKVKLRVVLELCRKETLVSCGRRDTSKSDGIVRI